MHAPDTDDRIAELWEELPSTFGTARADLLMELGHHLIDADRFDEALPVVETAEELYADGFDDVARGRAAHNRAVILGRLGRLDEQLGAECESIGHYERAQRRDLAGCSRMSLGQTLANAGRPKDALTHFEAARQDFDAAGERHHLANALMCLVDVNVDLGRFRVAATFLAPAFTATTQAAPIPTVARLHELAAQIFECRNGAAAARQPLRQARAIWDALDEQDQVAACDIRLAVLDITTASPEAATTTLQSLRDERRAEEDVAGVAACDRGLGLAALARHQPRQAERRFEAASAVFSAAALFGDASECDALAARALAAQGRPAEAIKPLQRAARHLERYRRPRPEVEARVELARLLLAAGDHKGALREAKRAESVAKHGLPAALVDAARVLRYRAEAARTAGAGHRI